jgi:hypothetical protein
MADEKNPIDAFEDFMKDTENATPEDRVAAALVRKVRNFYVVADHAGLEVELMLDAYARFMRSYCATAFSNSEPTWADLVVMLEVTTIQPAIHGIQVWTRTTDGAPWLVA